MRATLLAQRYFGSHISQVASSKIQQATLNFYKLRTQRYTTSGAVPLGHAGSSHSGYAADMLLVYRRHERNIKIIVSWDINSV